MKLQPLYVDARVLAKANACQSQRDLFVRTFGKGKVPLNKRNWNKAVKVGLEVRWLVRIFFFRYATPAELMGHINLSYFDNETRWGMLQKVRERLAREGVKL